MSKAGHTTNIVKIVAFEVIIEFDVVKGVVELDPCRVQLNSHF